MPDRLIQSEARLKHHFAEMGKIFESQIESSARVNVSADFSSNRGTAGLVGPDTEYIERERGGRVSVVPFQRLSSSHWAWLGYFEEWDEARRAPSTRRFGFRCVSLTFFFGQVAAVNKRQVFRLEWSGFANWHGTEPSFQAGTAGHPHWQIDAATSATRSEGEAAASLLAEIRSADSEPTAKDFDPGTTDGIEMFNADFSRLHLAGAAAWWETEQHQHTPSGTDDIKHWTDRGLTYTKSELLRLAK